MHIISLYKKPRSFSGIENVVSAWKYEAGIDRRSTALVGRHQKGTSYIVHGLHNLNVFMAPFTKLYGAKTFVMPHGQCSKRNTPKLFRKIYYSIVSKMLLCYDGIIFLSAREQDQFLLTLSPKIRRIIISNGISPADIQEPKTEFPHHPLTYGYIGRIDENQKGLISFAKLIIAHSDKLQDIARFEIYGPDCKEKNKLISLTKNCNLISIHPPIYNTTKKISVIRSFDYAFLCSHFEGEPLYALEAQSCAVPIISTTNSNVKNPDELKKKLVAHDQEGLIELMISASDCVDYLKISGKVLAFVSSKTWLSVVENLKSEINLC